MNKTFIKKVGAISLAVVLFGGCVSTQSNNPQPTGDNQTQMNKAQTGALIGAALGALAGATTKNKDRGKRAVIGGAIGAAIGGGIGYAMDKQAKELAQELDTNVNNNPNAPMNPDNDLIVSNTDKYVKIMLRDQMVFETNSATPTPSAAMKISKIANVLQNYPTTLVQVVGFTDSRGTYEYNKKLSQERATNVANTIYNSGIPNPVYSKGCSYDKPVVANSTKENMALNRRVEIYLYPNEESIIDPCVE